MPTAASHHVEVVHILKADLGTGHAEVSRHVFISFFWFLAAWAYSTAAVEPQTTKPSPPAQLSTLYLQKASPSDMQFTVSFTMSPFTCVSLFQVVCCSMMTPKDIARADSSGRI